MANRGLFFLIIIILYTTRKINITYYIVLKTFFHCFKKKKKKKEDLFPFGGFRSLPKWHKALILSIIEKLIQYSGE